MRQACHIRHRLLIIKGLLVLFDQICQHHLFIFALERPIEIFSFFARFYKLQLVIALVHFKLLGCGLLQFHVSFIHHLLLYFQVSVRHFRRFEILRLKRLVDYMFNIVYLLIQLFWLFWGFLKKKTEVFGLIQMSVTLEHGLID